MFSSAIIFQDICLTQNMCSLLTPGMTSIRPKSRNTLWSTVTKSPTRKTNTEIEKSKTQTEAPCIMYQTLPNLFVRCVCLQFYTQRKKHAAGLGSAVPGWWSAAVQPVAEEATYGGCTGGQGSKPPWGRSLSLTIRAPWWFSSCAS